MNIYAKLHHHPSLQRITMPQSPHWLQWDVPHLHIQQAALLMERDNRLAHYFGQFGGLGLLLEYLATSGVIVLLGDPRFPTRRQNFVRISLSFRDLTQDRLTDDRCGDQNKRLPYLIIRNAPNIISLDYTLVDGTLL